MDINWAQIFISFLFTLYIYVVPAIIIRFVIVKAAFDRKKSIRCAVILGCYTYVVMSILLLTTGGELPKIYLAFCYGSVNCFIFGFSPDRKGSKPANDVNVQKQSKSQTGASDKGRILVPHDFVEARRYLSSKILNDNNDVAFYAHLEALDIVACVSTSNVESDTMRNIYTYLDTVIAVMFLMRIRISKNHGDLKSTSEYLSAYSESLRNIICSGHVVSVRNPNVINSLFRDRYNYYSSIFEKNDDETRIILEFINNLLYSATHDEFRRSDEIPFILNNITGFHDYLKSMTSYLNNILSFLMENYEELISIIEDF